MLHGVGGILFVTGRGQPSLVVAGRNLRLRSTIRRGQGSTVKDFTVEGDHGDLCERADWVGLNWSSASRDAGLVSATGAGSVLGRRRHSVCDCQLIQRQPDFADPAGTSRRPMDQDGFDQLRSNRPQETVGACQAVSMPTLAITITSTTVPMGVLWAAACST